ncbi:MAG TPA: GNAT family N-acetyltransferase [Polyangiaceae bacterium]|nr:GNAT family N-acetyltransferase [Polyangiaceae bacterium]
MTSSAPGFLRLETERLLLTVPERGDAPRLLAFNQRNREHLRPFSPPEPSGTDELDFWLSFVARLQRDFLAGVSVPLRIALRDDPTGPFIGGATLSQIYGGPFAACYLGYQLDWAWVGQGIMHEALTRLIEYAFAVRRLHRIMANYVPSNTRSARVLSRLGFTIEGYAREYLFIDGAWRDHVLTSLTNRELSAPGD